MGRNDDIEFLPLCSGPEIKESIKKYNSMLDLDLFFLYTSKMIKFLTCEKIDFFKRKKGIKYRDIQRRFKKIRKEDLCAMLDYLIQEKLDIIKWDKENKRIFLHPNYKENSYWFSFHCYEVYQHSINFRKVYPRSKKVLFKHPQDFQFYYIPSFYQATKEMFEKLNKTARI